MTKQHFWRLQASTKNTGRKPTLTCLIMQRAIGVDLWVLILALHISKRFEFRNAICMKIEINNNRKIFAIQEEFKTEFPNLNIMFYEKPSKPGGSPSTKMVTSSAKFLAECRAIHHSGHISILPQMLVGDLKQNFRDVFGLAIEIFPRLSTVAANGDTTAARCSIAGVLSVFLALTCRTRLRARRPPPAPGRSD